MVKVVCRKMGNGLSDLNLLVVMEVLTAMMISVTCGIN